MPEMQSTGTREFRPAAKQQSAERAATLDWQGQPPAYSQPQRTPQGAQQSGRFENSRQQPLADRPQRGGQEALDRSMPQSASEDQRRLFQSETGTSSSSVPKPNQQGAVSVENQRDFGPWGSSLPSQEESRQSLEGSNAQRNEATASAGSAEGLIAAMEDQPGDVPAMQRERDAMWRQSRSSRNGTSVEDTAQYEQQAEERAGRRY